ncbi:MAG: LamG domain-containing protein, partial [Dysgonamonadaceae bacterium]|nr:LamG domain-containing protein [Dysgonamonadaceae bacterium]
MKTNVTLVFLMLGLSLFAQTDNSAELVAKYTFETGLVNELNSAVSGEALAEENGTLPTFEQNEERGGQVLHVYFGFTGDNNSSLTTSYVQFPNPLQGIENLSGASVSLWVNRLDNDLWDAIWGFLDEDNSDDVDGRFYLTPNAYLGFNGTGGWFDCNWPENVTDAIAQSEWNMVTVTVNTGGFTIYVNGEKRYDKTTYATWGAIDDITSADFNYSNVINLIKS